MSATGIQAPRNTASDYAALQFIVEQMLTRLQTSTPVRVMSVTNAGDLSPVGRVDVLPLVNQMTGDGQPIPHKTIYNVPYCRMQGGGNAVILDPQVGDIGICVFASRDISSVKADPQAAASNGGANPGSERTYNFADAVYLGGILNGAPTQVVQFSAEGIRLLSPTKITLEAPLIDIKGPVTASSTIVAQGDVTGQGTSLHTHRHTGVTVGGGNTGTPL